MRLERWEPSFCSLDRLIAVSANDDDSVGNLHSVALIDLVISDKPDNLSWEPSFCSLDRLIVSVRLYDNTLGTFIL